MMKFKSQLVVRLFFGIVFSLVLFSAYLFDALSSGLIKYLSILLIGLVCIWSVYLILTISSLTVIITETEIVAKRFGKIRWAIKKSNIQKIEYTGWFWWGLFFAADVAAEVRIYPTAETKRNHIPKGGGDCLCFGATKRQVKKIKQLGFEITNIR